MKRIVARIDPEAPSILESPYYQLMEHLKIESKQFKPVESNIEFNRMLAQPQLMIPFVSEELRERIPPPLLMPHPEDEA